MKKNFLLSLLVCVNMVLLTGLILASYSPPAANAQTVGLAGNYLMVAGEIRNGTDALYVVDLPKRRLHVFIPNHDLNNRRLIYRHYRDLEYDFRKVP